MSNIKMSLDKLENQVMGSEPITIIIRDRPFPGVKHFDPYKTPEKFLRVEGWPLNYNVFAEKKEHE
jgi:hypothetical protein